MPKNPKPTYEFGCFCLDTNEHRLLKQGRPVQLPPKPFEALVFLVENHGRLISKQNFVEALWPDVYVTEVNLNRHISFIRQVLGESPQDRNYIETIPKIGFRFVADVTEIKSPLLTEKKQNLHGETIRPIVGESEIENAPVLRAYHKGLFYQNQGTEQQMREAIAQFEETIRSDPGYALAYLQLAYCYNWIARHGRWPALELRHTAEQMARKALEIDDSLGEAYRILADVRLSNGDWCNLDEDYRRAIELSSVPSHKAEAKRCYSIYLLAMGKYRDGVVQVRQAQRLDPLSAYVNTYLGRVLYLTRNDDEAIEHLLQTLKWNPNYVMARQFLGDAYVHKGLYQEALAQFQQGASLLGLSTEKCFIPKDDDTRALSSDGVALLCSTGYLYGQLGNKTAVKKLLGFFKKLSKEMFISPLRVADIHIGAGEFDEALSQLEDACQLRVHGLYMLPVSPIYERLRTNRRFQKLVTRIRRETEYIPYRMSAIAKASA